MARKTTRRRRPRRRPNVPAPGGPTGAPPARSGNAPRAPRAKGGQPAVVAATADEDLGATYKHVAVDLRRILVLGVIMFALIAGAKVLADIYGTSFVLDLIR